jgi:transposase-like protein
MVRRGERPRRHTPEFKVEAVRLMRERLAAGLTLQRVSEELEISAHRSVAAARDPGRARGEPPPPRARTNERNFATPSGSHDWEASLLTVASRGVQRSFIGQREESRRAGERSVSSAESAVSGQPSS